MSSIPFGEQLKREREMRGVSIEEISAATRISTRFLEALEKERWDQLPGGVFNRGFIRSIARFLGLDGDTMVAEYELERKAADPGTPAAFLVPQEIPRNWRPAAAALALVAALVAGGWFAYQRYALEISTRILKHPAVLNGSAAEPIVASDPAISAEPRSAVQQTSTLANTSLELKIQAGKAADVKIVADGQTVFDGRVDADQSKEFTAKNSFAVSASDATALLMELNGQTLPPLGKPGEPGTVTLSHKDLQPEAGGGN
jgi:cytoskeletal protein RodZ